MTITRMQEPRQMYQQGGIMQVAPRQGYFVGKLVKSIGKGVKKFVKSDLGKAALLGAAAFGVPGTQFGGLLGRASFGGPAASIFGKSGGIQALLPSVFGTPGIPDRIGKQGFIQGLKTKFGDMGTGTKIGIASGLLTYLGSQGMEQEEIEEVKRDPDKLRVYLKDYFTKLNPNASSTEIEEFVETNVSEYKATGGRVGLMGGAMPTGIMRTNQAGTIERDYRDEGGFVPVGIKEKADDVPAMLSKNEFVMTADAVRGAGDGSIEKGAQKMYDQMKRLENKVA